MESSIFDALVVRCHVTSRLQILAIFPPFLQQSRQTPSSDIKTIFLRTVPQRESRILTPQPNQPSYAENVTAAAAPSAGRDVAPEHVSVAEAAPALRICTRSWPSSPPTCRTWRTCCA